MEGIKEILRVFNSNRGLDKYHSPENLAKAISVDAGELLRNFQWDRNYDLHQVSDDLVNIMIHSIILADKLDLDVKNEIIRKIGENANRHPAFHKEPYTFLENDDKEEF